MKRLISCFLALAMTLALAGCGAPEEKPEEPAAAGSAQTGAESAVQEDTPEEVAEEVPAGDGLRPEFKAAMDSFEAFYDEYCAFMTKFAENPGDLAMLTEYAGMMEQLGDMGEKLEAWESEDLNGEELAYYLEVNGRITQKLLEAAG